MKKIEITYEKTKRACRIFEVTNEEYASIKNGDVSIKIKTLLQEDIDTGYCDSDYNWAAVDCKTGEVLQDWRG